MNFFQHQDLARKQTGVMVLLFSCALIGILVAVNLVLGLFIVFQSSDAKTLDQLFQLYPELFITISLATLALIISGTLWKINQISSGGKAVAEMVGARQVDPATQDPAERRLINVVEEMAIASGSPVPAIYLMDEEPGINAFAAGFTPNEAVIAVTSGALQCLNRDELQGVMAHEFSHIFNGDMRINIRLIGVLHGVLLIGLIGASIMRSFARANNTSYSYRFKTGTGKSRRQNVLPLILLGAALMAVGYIGVFFGRMIKAAVSRQREYLADASAVQFTRNNLGIGGALKKIRLHVKGTRIDHPNAETLSHLYFGAGISSGFTNMLATHPPIDERIHRLMPHWLARRAPATASGIPEAAMAEVAAGLQSFSQSELSTPTQTADHASFSKSSQQVLDSIGNPGLAHLVYAAQLHRQIPQNVLAAAHHPTGASALLLCLALDQRPQPLKRQLDLLKNQASRELIQEVDKWHPWVRTMDKRVRLPIFDLCLPVRKKQSAADNKELIRLIGLLVTADRQITLEEFVILSLSRRHLARGAGKTERIRYRHLKPLLPDIRLLLSVIARTGHKKPTEMDHAFTLGYELVSNHETTLLPLTECKMLALDLALSRLRTLALMPRMKVINACATCVLADGKAGIREAEILRAICDTLDCPLPPLLEEQPG